MSSFGWSAGRLTQIHGPSIGLAPSMHGNRTLKTKTRPLAGPCRDSFGWRALPYLPDNCFAFSDVIAVVSTVTVASTEVAQSSRIFFDMSIASLAPVG